MTIHRTCMIAALFVVFAARAAAQPAVAVLISPASDITGTTIAFTWQSMPTATWYHFWLGRADASLLSEQWYTAEHARCATGGTCTITLTPPVTPGAFIWHIRTWSSAGYGPWSPPHMFTVRDLPPSWSAKLPSSRRFTLVLGDAAVLDNETGLVWQRVPVTNIMQWAFAQGTCAVATTGGRWGWRRPTLAELQSLLDPTATPPRLPSNHPFNIAGTTLLFWTQNSLVGTTNFFAVAVDTGTLYGYPDGATYQVRVWCVRGGTASQ
jgi:hypothetical protein